MDPQLLQAGLPDRVELRVNGQPSVYGSTIVGSITLMQAADAMCDIRAQAVIVVVRIW